jgi:hypothetical protein
MKFFLLAAAALLAGCGSKAPPGPPTLTNDKAAREAFLQDAGLQKTTMSAYIRGKVAVLSRKTRGLEPGVQRLLPPALGAETRDDVQTVVWVDWSTTRVPDEYYKSMKNPGQKFYAVQWVADLTVIDWKKQLILGYPRFTGAAPTENYKSVDEDGLNAAEGVAGPKPFQDIADYLIRTASSISVPP